MGTFGSTESTGMEMPMTLTSSGIKLEMRGDARAGQHLMFETCLVAEVMGIGLGLLYVISLYP